MLGAQNLICELQNKHMNETDYLPGEFTTDYLHLQADAGDHLLEKEGLQYRPRATLSASLSNTQKLCWLAAGVWIPYRAL
jgi:hypothetical protein